MAAVDTNCPTWPVRPCVRLYVFSITVNWQRLREELTSKHPDGEICVVTPHDLFSCERELLAKLCPNVREFRTFHDLLELEDMEFCDAEADRLVTAHQARREEHIGEYYEAIKRLKNQRAASRLLTQFQVAGGAVLCDDLGLVAEIWIALGLADLRTSAERRMASRWSRLRRMLSAPVRCHYLEWNSRCWLLVGRSERLAQYLDQSTVTLRPLGMVTRWWFTLQILAVLKVKLSARLVRRVMWAINLPWRIRVRSVEQVAATVHEDNLAVARLAESLGLEYVNFQDSFLPSYYPSRYLLYRPAVRRFYVWDNSSRGIFDRHGLESSRWMGYRSWKLPPLSRTAQTLVRRVLYLSSGAGDWTALKNRSDEDRALEMLVTVARARPDLTIYYRPHPLWVHPDHQGLNSIERVIDCLAVLGLPNILVSQGARSDGRRFSLTGNLSTLSSSVDEDIGWADLVLGEHSQTILVAAQRRKMIAGVNVSKHPAFFSDYAKMGFPLVTSAEELLDLIGRIDTAAEFLVEYNNAIARHNHENCDAVHSGG